MRTWRGLSPGLEQPGLFLVAVHRARLCAPRSSLLQKAVKGVWVVVVGLLLLGVSLNRLYLRLNVQSSHKGTKSRRETRSLRPFGAAAKVKLKD